eukprot:g4385.t1
MISLVSTSGGIGGSSGGRSRKRSVSNDIEKEINPREESAGGDVLASPNLRGTMKGGSNASSSSTRDNYRNRTSSGSRQKMRHRKRGNSVYVEAIFKLDQTMPRWLWAIALVFFLLGAVGIVFCGYVLLWFRTAAYDAKMPKQIAADNLTVNIIFDIAFGWFGWGFLSFSMVFLVWLGFALYGVLPSHYVRYALPRLDRIMAGKDFASRFTWTTIVILWMLVFGWYFKYGFLLCMGDVNLDGHGNMFAFAALPKWIGMGSNSQYFVGPSDLYDQCPSEHSCEQRIEKIIHQTYKTTDLPDHWKDTPQAWKDMHPDWEYIFWTDQSARDFIEQNYEWFLETFDAYPHPIQRADAIRYFALYHYGGVYADMDLQPKQHLGHILSGVDVVNFETPNLGLTNMMLAVKSRSRFMRCVIAQLGPRQFQSHHVLLPARGWQILSSTGPTFWWAMNTPGVCNDGTTETFRTIGSNYMGRCSLCNGDVSKCAKEGIMRHLVGSSWHKNDQNALNFLFCQPSLFWAAIFIPVRTAIALVAFKMQPHTAGQWLQRGFRELVVTNALLVASCAVVGLLTVFQR